jgi:hypothetical protein
LITPDALAAYVGLVPSEHSSGQSRRLGKITKAGSRQDLSDLLCEVGVTDTALGAGKGHPCPLRK